tara:strand:- start:141 stop:323 length:183 start_codon:yes stop_codon:yes gene_type:complete
MELLLEEEPDVDEIIYPPHQDSCDKCKLFMTWIAVWTFGFGFGFLTKTYSINNEFCNGSM